MSARRLRVLALSLLLALGLAGCSLATPFTSQKSIAQNGGLRVWVELACPAGQNCASANMLGQTVAALQRRAQAGLGVADASAKAVGVTLIEVDLPGYTNQQAAVSALSAQGLVQIIDTRGVALDIGATVAPNQYPVVFTGSQIAPSSVSAIFDPGDTEANDPVVMFSFQGAAKTQFAQYTGAHIGSYLTITLDNRVIESAVIQSQIDGPGQISGFKSLDDAKALAAELKTTPLPEPVSLVNSDTFQASGG